MSRAGSRPFRRFVASAVTALLVASGLFAIETIAAPPASAATTSCSFGTTGPAASTICWLDMAAYDNTAARSAAGQPFSLTMPGGYNVSYNLIVRENTANAGTVGTPPSPPVVAPSPQYTGTTGNTRFYVSGMGNRTTATLRNIAVTDSTGAAVTGYALVSADAEITASIERITWNSNTPITQVALLHPPAGPGLENGCQTVISGFGTNTVTCTGAHNPLTTPGPFRYGSAVVKSTNATTFSATVSEDPAAFGTTGVAFGFMVAKLTLNKTVDGRVNPSDSFATSMTAPNGTVIGSATTGTGNSSTTGTSTILPVGTYTLAEAPTAGSGTNLALYGQSWNCTNATAGSGTVLPSGSGTSKTVTPVAGDDITCTLTNTAFDIPESLGSCDTRALGVRANGSPANTMALDAMDLVTGGTSNLYSPDPIRYGAIGYSRVDDRVYGIEYSNSNLSTGHIVVVGADYQAHRLPLVAGLPVGVNFALGDVDASGRLHVTTVNNPTPVYVIDVNPASPTFGTLLGSYTIDKALGGNNIGADWAFSPIDGNLYAAGPTGNVYRIVPGALGAAGTISTLKTIPPGTGGYGSAFMDASGFAYFRANAGAVYRTSTTSATPDAVLFATMPGSSATDGARCADASIPIDFGDAPDSYGTSLGSNGPRHTVAGYDAATNTAPLMLGSQIDIESDGFASAASDGDDLDGAADENGVSSPIAVSTTGPTSVTVSVTNTTGGPATLAGWIDVNGSGTFEPGERVVVPIAASGDYVLTFPAPTTANPTFARLRLFAGDVVDPRPTGAGSGGEVEDYPVVVTELSITKTSDATEDSRPGDTITYTVTAQNTGTADFPAQAPAVVSDDLSDVLDDAAYNGDAIATIDGTNAGPVTIVDGVLGWAGALPAGETVVVTYTVTLGSDGDGVVRNVAWGGGDDTPECDPPVDGVDPVTGLPCAEHELLLPRLTISKSSDVTDLPADGGVVTYTVTVENVGPGVYTVDAPALVTDDLSAVLDDATYQGDAAATVDGNATTSPAFTSPDLVWSGPLASGGVLVITYSVEYDDTSGDNILRNVVCLEESETAPGQPPCDFVQIPAAGLTQWKQAEPSAVPTVAGSTITYTLFFANDGQTGAAVDARDDLTHVLDDAQITSGPSSPDGLTANLAGDFLGVTGTVAPGQTYTVTYTVTVLPDDDRGDDIATNFLLEREGGEFPPTPPEPDCVPTNAQFPDCTTNRFPALEFEKAVDASTDPVAAGTVLTYTITVRNTGEALGTVNKVDDLSGVLDDAELATQPSSDTGSVIVSHVSSGVFSIGGSLSAGGIAEITYTVTVLPENERGDDLATNFVLDPGQEPPETCAPSAVPCTETGLPNIVVTKAVQASTDPVGPGTVLSYMISFENIGQASGAVDKVDDLTGVLDDAELTNGPTASDLALTLSSVTDGRFSITGTLAADQLVTVQYQVTVVEEADRGDSRATNFVLDPGQDPPTQCEPGTVTCTMTPMPEIHDRKDVDPVSGTPVVTGQQLTYTLTFRNDGPAPGPVDRVDDLTHLVDDADLTEAPTVSDAAVAATGPDAQNRITISGSLAAGQQVTVTYTVTVRTDEQRGDEIIANYLLAPGQAPPTDPVCTPEPGEEPDCTRNEIGQILPSKTSNPTSFTDVATGQTITYTLTFENVGAGTADVDYTDILGGVLDDARLVGEPTATDGLDVAGPTGDELRITGTLAGATTAHVTYTVVVKSYEEQGDHRLANFVGPTGFTPPTLCNPADPLCTWHEIDPPPPGLAVTGVAIGGSIAGAALLALAGGIVLTLVRRRRMEEALQDS